MTIESRYSVDADMLIIDVKGKFDFTLLNTFRHSYADVDNVTKVIIDMRDTSSIDSSALGMLLNMKSYLDESDVKIGIKNCNKDVKNIFDITHFHKKFTIE